LLKVGAVIVHNTRFAAGYVAAQQIDSLGKVCFMENWPAKPIVRRWPVAGIEAIRPSDR
jgi:hypothetical protein